MKLSLALIFLFVFFLSTNCFSEEQHLIDKFLESEITKDSTTAGINAATQKAMEKWDTEMNKYYKMLINTLDDKSKEILRASQKKWINYKDKEFDNINNIFGQLEGTIYTTMAIASKNDLVKRRALNLKEYYELLSEQTVGYSRAMSRKLVK